MARPSRPWFRFYTEALSDRKLRRLTPAQRWLWVAVLGAARMSPVPGFLVLSEREPMDEHDLADIAGMTAKEVAAALPLFERAEMIERDNDLGAWVVTNWRERQFESDDVTKRTGKHRSKEDVRNVPKNDGTVLPGTPELARTRTSAPRALTTEADTETETEAVQNQRRAQTGVPTRPAALEAAATILLERRNLNGKGASYRKATLDGIATDLTEWASTRTLTGLDPQAIAELYDPPPPPPKRDGPAPPGPYIPTPVPDALEHHTNATRARATRDALRAADA